MGQILEKYMRLIHEAVPDTGTHVFRGQRNAEWPLQSGASRRLAIDGVSENDPHFLEEYLEYHRDLLDRARRVAPYGQSVQSDSPLQLLARLQHFGAATGLLDFTYSPLVALWFASEHACRDGKVFDGKVFFVRHGPPNTTFVTEELEGQDITNILSRTRDITGPGYLLWEPLVAGDAALRILGQRSVFVIGRPVVSEEDVDWVEISATDKELLRAELEQVDVSARTIFRDLVGFCQLEGAKARRAGPTTLAQYLRRANGAYRRGACQEAVEAYGKCLEFREASETFFLRGNANAALGWHQDAIDDYGRALASKDVSSQESIGIYFNRGNEQACLGRYADAIADYRRVTDLEPLYQAAHYNCGNVYFMQRQYADAVACYDQALTLHSQYVPALVNKALALVLQGKLEAAEACYRLAQRVEPPRHNTLEPLLELKAAFVGLSEAGITVEVVETGNTLTATASHPDYRSSSSPAVLFKGIHGNTGNMGGLGFEGGEGFEGGPGVLVVIQGAERG